MWDLFDLCKKYPQEPSTSFSTSIPFPVDHCSTLSPFRAWAVSGNTSAGTDIAAETRLKRLAEEIAPMGHELGQFQADLSESLKRVYRLCRRTNGGSLKKIRFGLSTCVDESVDQHLPDPARGGKASGGGISISKMDLGLMLAEAQAKPLPPYMGISGATKEILSLERLAKAVKDSESRTSDVLTLPLWELASMLRSAQTESQISRDIGTSRRSVIGRLFSQLPGWFRMGGLSQDMVQEPPWSKRI